MDFKDKIIKLAFSIHSSPGIYALLLGSGISRDAGIPTGWEVVLDLIKKVAAMEGEVPDPDLEEEWYKKRYGESPSYSKLLAKLTNTPTERAKLLHSYFEPTDEEREEGLKVPTIAHKAIATLVKYGYIRMILTTNFDRLLEKALEEQGITPNIISTDDALEGAMPYVHSQCTILKLHGDYMDTRIKNTAEELSQYSDKLNAYLDRVFDEFGLIICGWSAEWDVALRDALYRRKNRRFSTYWAVRGELGDEAVRLIKHLQAEVITIESANQFFTELLEKVEGLRDIERPHPLSAPLAIATVKKYLADEKNYIKLHDLITEEVERICRKLSSEHFKTEGVTLNEELFQQRMHEYEELVKMLIGMLSTLAYFDDGKYVKLITKSIERLLQIPRKSGYVALVDLQRYPALLLTYSIGLTALEAENYEALAAPLLKPNYRDDSGVKRPAIEFLNVGRVFKRGSHKWVPYPNAGSRYTPANDYIFDFMREPLRCYLPDDVKYEEIFDIFEYILGLVYIDLLFKDPQQESIWAPVGRFGWKYYGDLSRRTRPSPIDEFVQNGLNQIGEWALFKAGFFGGPRRFRACHEAYENYLKKTCKFWF